MLPVENQRKSGVMYNFKINNMQPLVITLCYFTLRTFSCELFVVVNNNKVVSQQQRRWVEVVAKK